MGLQWPTAATRQGASPMLPQDLDRLHGITDDRDVDSGTKLLRAGQEVDRVIVVGSAVVELGAASPSGRRVAAVDTTAGSVCELSGQALLRFLATSPEVCLRWMWPIAVRLDEERRRMHALATTDLRGQTALLLQHAEQPYFGPSASATT